MLSEKEPPDKIKRRIYTFIKWRHGMEFSTEELAPIAEQIAELCVRKMEREQDRQIMALENGLRQGLKKLGGMVLTSTLSQAERELEREIACQCGGTLHYQRRREAKIESLFGWVEYERSYYAECECSKGKAPLDEEFGLEPGKVTPGLARLLALAGLGLPFGESTNWIDEFLLLELSENSIRKETQSFGQYQVDCEEKLKGKCQDEAYLQERIRTETEQPEQLYGSLDGAHVRIEDPEENEKWRETKVGCWYRVEVVPVNQQTQRHRKKKEIGYQALRAKDQQYYCDIQEVDDFEPLFWATGCQAKADLAKELVFLGDGAKWIWRLVGTHYPNAVQIVDWYHAEEYLEKVAKDAFPNGEKRNTWLEDARTSLWWGDTSFVIRACQALALRSEEASTALTYFRNNEHRMQYDHFRGKGYMIGSGTIESACKQIVSHRLRCSGAQWKVEGARLTAKARAAWLSGKSSWETLCSLRAKLPLAA
ncbi:MAG: ISKra4 family transposase [Anaerolineae bacterium]|nr:ISKra4 family transposase [Anaerolineae bacterium]